MGVSMKNGAYGHKVTDRGHKHERTDVFQSVSSLDKRGLTVLSHRFCMHTNEKTPFEPNRAQSNKVWPAPLWGSLCILGVNGV